LTLNLIPHEVFRHSLTFELVIPVPEMPPRFGCHPPPYSFLPLLGISTHTTQRKLPFLRDFRFCASPLRFALFSHPAFGETSVSDSLPLPHHGAILRKNVCQMVTVIILQYISLKYWYTKRRKALN